MDMIIKEKKVKFLICVMSIIVVINFLLLVKTHLHKHKKVISNKKVNPQDTESSSLEAQTIDAKQNTEIKKGISNWKNLSTWDKWIIVFFWIIAIYEITGILGFWNYSADNMVLSLFGIFVFGWDLFHIENNNASENQKKTNNFFEILIFSIIVSTVITLFVPGFSINVKLLAAIDLFKLFLGSIILGLVISIIQNSNNFTWLITSLSIITLCTVFISYSNFSAIEKNLDNIDNPPSAQEFKKIIANSSKSEIENYNKVIKKALKK